MTVTSSRDQTKDARLHRRGILLMVGAGFCWSTGGILVRNVALTDPWEIVLWRSIFMVIFLFGVLSVWHRGEVFRRIGEVGIHGTLAGIFLGSTFILFILSVTRNTVANTLVLMSTSPFFIAFLGMIFLRERVPLRTWSAMAAGLAGITLMFSEGLDQGQSLGNLLALGIPATFALNVMVLRRARAHVNMVPSVMLAGIFSLLFALPLAWPLSPSLRDLTVLGIMGCVQLGTGCLLMTIAVRYLSAGEVGLLSLLETTLGPIWVWLGIGERPTDLALLGGVIVVGSLLANEWLGMRERESKA